jgi:hypothetical protein
MGVDKDSGCDEEQDRSLGLVLRNADGLKLFHMCLGNMVAVEVR